MPKPGDFFLGLFQFFAILVPGGFLLLGLYIIFWESWSVKYNLLSSGASWTIFFLASYLAGHILQLPADVIDKRVYDQFYKIRFERGNWEPLATAQKITGERIFYSLARLALTWYFFLYEGLKSATLKEEPENRCDANKLVDEARSLAWGKECSIEDTSTYDWAYATVQTKNVAAAAEVERLQADSKLFRSVATALPFLSIACTFRLEPIAFFAAAVAIASVSPMLWRYCYLRRKAVQHTYEYYLILERQK